MRAKFRHNGSHRYKQPVKENCLAVIFKSLICSQQLRTITRACCTRTVRHDRYISDNVALGNGDLGCAAYARWTTVCEPDALEAASPIVNSTRSIAAIAKRRAVLCKKFACRTTHPTRFDWIRCGDACRRTGGKIDGKEHGRRNTVAAHNWKNPRCSLRKVPEPHLQILGEVRESVERMSASNSRNATFLQRADLALTSLLTPMPDARLFFFEDHLWIKMRWSIEAPLVTECSAVW